MTAAGNDLRLAGLVVGHWMRAVVCAGVLAVTTGCASVFNEPINAPLAAGQSAASMLPPDVQGDTAVALAFSGGGTRAAAFAYGVMRGLDRMRGPDGRSHMDRLIFVSGVSGGSVAAAYVGLKGKAALSDFRERFLLRNAEEDLATSVNLRHLVRGLSGGVNDASRLPVWLDKNLFDNATMGDLQKPGRPVVWINASDLYNRTPFHFSPPVFAALCSDIRGYPLSQAVAASAAVPVAFAPIVLETFPDACTAPLPPWVDRVLADPGAGAQVGAQVRAFAQALLRYRDPGQVRYVKLVDGGLTDNFGLSGLVIARAIADTPYMPFTPDKAVQLSRLVFVVVNAGRAPEGDWARSVEGPSGAALLTAVTDTAIDSAVRSGFDAFRLSIREWEEATRRWRCRLSAAEAKRLGAGRNWRCSHLKFEVAEVSFDQLDPARMALVATVPTRFNLPAAQVDMVIDAGTDLVLTHPVFKGGVVRANARISQQVDATIR